MHNLMNAIDESMEIRALLNLPPDESAAEHVRNLLSRQRDEPDSDAADRVLAEYSDMGTPEEIKEALERAVQAGEYNAQLNKKIEEYQQAALGAIDTPKTNRDIESELNTLVILHKEIRRAHGVGSDVDIVKVAMKTRNQIEEMTKRIEFLERDSNRLSSLLELFRQVNVKATRTNIISICSIAIDYVESKGSFKKVFNQWFDSSLTEIR